MIVKWKLLFVAVLSFIFVSQLLYADDLNYIQSIAGKDLEDVGCVECRLEIPIPPNTNYEWNCRLSGVARRIVKFLPNNPKYPELRFKIDLRSLVLEYGAENVYLLNIVDMYNATDYLLNIGNSPTNNGFGGDNGDFSNDSELQFRDFAYRSGHPEWPYYLEIYPNEYEDPFAITPEQRDPLAEICFHSWELYPNFRLILVLKEHDVNYSLQGENNTLLGCGHIHSSYIFNLGGEDNQAGRNDYVYWFAYNRNLYDGNLRGEGVNYIVLRISVDNNK